MNYNKRKVRGFDDGGPTEPQFYYTPPPPAPAPAPVLSPLEAATANYNAALQALNSAGGEDFGTAINNYTAAKNALDAVQYVAPPPPAPAPAPAPRETPAPTAFDNDPYRDSEDPGRFLDFTPKPVAPTSPWEIDAKQFNDAIAGKLQYNNVPANQVSLQLANGRVWTPGGAGGGITYHPADPGGWYTDTSGEQDKQVYRQPTPVAYYEVSGDLSEMLGTPGSDKHASVKYVEQNGKMVPMEEPHYWNWEPDTAFQKALLVFGAAVLGAGFIAELVSTAGAASTAATLESLGVADLAGGLSSTAISSASTELVAAGALAGGEAAAATSLAGELDTTAATTGATSSFTISGVLTSPGAAIGNALGITNPTLAQMVGNTIIETARNGGDVGKAIQNAAMSTGLSLVGSSVSGAVTNALKDIPKDVLPDFVKAGISQGVSGAVAATATGRSPLSALTGAALGTAVNGVIGEIPGLSDLPPEAQSVARAAVTASLTGKDITDAALAAALAEGKKVAAGYVDKAMGPESNAVTAANPMSTDPSQRGSSTNVAQSGTDDVIAGLTKAGLSEPNLSEETVADILGTPGVAQPGVQTAGVSSETVTDAGQRGGSPFQNLRAGETAGQTEVYTEDGNRVEYTPVYGTTADGKPYVYSIVYDRDDPAGPSYSYSWSTTDENAPEGSLPAIRVNSSRNQPNFDSAVKDKSGVGISPTGSTSGAETTEVANVTNTSPGDANTGTGNLSDDQIEEIITGEQTNLGDTTSQEILDALGDTTPPGELSSGDTNLGSNAAGALTEAEIREIVERATANSGNEGGRDSSESGFEGGSEGGSRGGSNVVSDNQPVNTGSESLLGTVLSTDATNNTALVVTDAGDVTVVNNDDGTLKNGDSVVIATDAVTGVTDADTLTGGDGTDTVTGVTGADTLTGGTDTLVGSTTQDDIDQTLFDNNLTTDAVTGGTDTDEATTSINKTYVDDSLDRLGDDLSTDTITGGTNDADATYIDDSSDRLGDDTLSGYVDDSVDRLGDDSTYVDDSVDRLGDATVPGGADVNTDLSDLPLTDVNSFGDVTEVVVDDVDTTYVDDTDEEEEVDDTQCGEGYVYNLVTQECEKVEEEEDDVCKEGFHKDPVTGMCVPDEDEEGCAEGFHEDPATGLCVPDDDDEGEECPLGEVRNLNTGLCEKVSDGVTKPVVTTPAVIKPAVTTPAVTTPAVTKPKSGLDFLSLLGLLSPRQAQPAASKPELVGKAGWEEDEGPIDYTPFEYENAIAQAKTEEEKARMGQAVTAAQGGSVDDLMAMLGIYDQDDSQSTGDPYLDELLATIR